MTPSREAEKDYQEYFNSPPHKKNHIATTMINTVLFKISTHILTKRMTVLLAMIYALQKLKEPCRVVFYTRNTYIKNMILADNPEKWRRAEWKKSDGKGIQNQDLWKMFLEESTEHEIEIVYEKDSEYKETLQAYLQGKEV